MGWRTNCIHQHLIIGQGAVDWNVYFKALCDGSYDGTMSTPVYGWDEKTVEIAPNMLEQINHYFDKYPEKVKDRLRLLAMYVRTIGAAG